MKSSNPEHENFIPLFARKVTAYPCLFIVLLHITILCVLKLCFTQYVDNKKSTATGWLIIFSALKCPLYFIFSFFKYFLFFLQVVYVTGGCDFDTNLCQGTFEGNPHWFREVGLLDRRTASNINVDPGFGEAPLFDHTRPLTTKGMQIHFSSS